MQHDQHTKDKKFKTDRTVTVILSEIYHRFASTCGNGGRGNEPNSLIHEQRERVEDGSAASRICCQMGRKVLVHWCLVFEELIWSFEASTTISHIIGKDCKQILTTVISISLSLILSLNSATALHLPCSLSMLSVSLWVSSSTIL